MAVLDQIKDWLTPSRTLERPPTAPSQISRPRSTDEIATPNKRSESNKRKMGAEEHGTYTPKRIASAPPKEKENGSRLEQLPSGDGQSKTVQQEYQSRELSLQAEIDNLRRANEQQRGERLSLDREITNLKSAVATASEDHQQQSKMAEQEYQRRELSLQAEINNLKRANEQQKGEKYSLDREITSLKSALATASEEHQRQSKTAEQEYQRRELSLQVEVNNLKRANEQQRGEKHSLDCEITNLKSRLAAASEQHRQQSEKAEREYQRRESSLRNSLQRSAAAAHQQSNDQLRNFQQEAHRKESSLLSEISRLEWELAQHQAEKNEHKDKVELAHRAAKAIMSKIRSFDTSDTDAKVWFQSHGQSWYAFSRANACPDTNAMMARLAEPDLPELCEALSDFVVLEGPDRELPSKLLDQKGTPQLLLHALLANFICDKVIWSPFWSLEAIPPDDDQLPMPPKESMENLYQYLISLQESDAHKWRSSLARILAANGMDQPIPKSGKAHASGLSMPSSSNTATNKLQTHRRAYARHLAQVFLSGPARFLMRDHLGDAAVASAANQAAPPSPRPCLARLTDEIDEALRFSIKVWSGRSNIEKMGLEDFQQNPFNGYFVTGSDANVPETKTILAASSSTSLSAGSSPDGDENTIADMELYRGCGKAEACRGQRILVVVQPGIAAVGTEEGEGYDDWKAKRVWTRAQVFV